MSNLQIFVSQFLSQEKLEKAFDDAMEGKEQFYFAGMKMKSFSRDRIDNFLNLLVENIENNLFDNEKLIEEVKKQAKRWLFETMGWKNEQ